MNTIEQNQWSKLEYRDPRRSVLCAWVLGGLSQRLGVSDKVRDWRVRKLRSYDFEKQAALFCYGLNECSGERGWEYSMFEASDYDCVIQRSCGEPQRFERQPVQLKAVVPDDLNPKSSIEVEIQKLAGKYPKSPDLVVAIYVNRDGEIDFRQISIPKLGVRDLRVFGYASVDGFHGYVSDNLLLRREFGRFSYPALQPGEHPLGIPTA